MIRVLDKKWNPVGWPIEIKRMQLSIPRKCCILLPKQLAPRKGTTLWKGNPQTVQATFGCLLHDVGKAVYRAGISDGRHGEAGYRFVRDIDGYGQAKAVLDCIRYHHAAQLRQAKDCDPLAAIAYIADNIAAAADRRQTGDETQFARYLPLSPVFTHLNGEHPGHTLPPHALDGRLRLPLDGSFRLSAGDYEQILLDRGETDYFTALVQQEQSFCLQQAFLLYSADFSGIQKFIYSVSTRNALKSLRSRSFFLELCMEHYIDELLQLCGLSRANLLYSGGGHCYVLLPNTEKTVRAIQAWNTRFNDFLIEQFGVRLYLADGYTPWDTYLERICGEKLVTLERYFSSGDSEHGTAFLYRLMELLRQAQAGGGIALARYAYLLARLEPKRNAPNYPGYKRFSEDMYRWALNSADRGELLTAICIYVYRNRKRG